MKNYLLFAAGKDTPGIVAAVTGALYRHGCNLADSSMTRLASEFAMLLIFQAPHSFDIERFKSDVASLRRKGLLVDVKALHRDELATSRSHARPHLISVHGGDRPGIVYHVSRILADRRINITDVWTHRIPARSRSGYVLFVEVELPVGLNARGLERLLGRVATRFKLRVSVKAIDSSAL